MGYKQAVETDNLEVFEPLTADTVKHSSSGKPKGPRTSSVALSMTVHFSEPQCFHQESGHKSLLPGRVALRFSSNL